MLHSWANGRDMELSLKAAKALANLDEDFGAAKKYAEGVYLYHPQTRFRLVLRGELKGLAHGPKIKTKKMAVIDRLVFVLP